MQNTQNQAQQQHTTQRLTLAYVEDSHNLGCFVRLDGEASLRRAHFSPAIQRAGVVIRAGHVVAVDMASDPPEVVWRLGTRATILTVDGEQITLDLGYPNHRRVGPLPLRDERPGAERIAPLAAGDIVLLRGKQTEAAHISDVFTGDALAHPERLHAVLAQRSAQAEGGTLGHSCKR